MNTHTHTNSQRQAIYTHKHSHKRKMLSLTRCAASSPSCTLPRQLTMAGLACRAIGYMYIHICVYMYVYIYTNVSAKVRGTARGHSVAFETRKDRTCSQIRHLLKHTWPSWLTFEMAWKHPTCAQTQASRSYGSRFQGLRTSHLCKKTMFWNS